MDSTYSLCIKCHEEIEIGLEVSSPARRVIKKNQLSSSHIPTDSEVSQIMLAIHEMQKDVDYLSKLIDELRARRDKAQRNLDDCRAVVSPVRRVPVEILTEIFSSCTHKDNHLCVDLDKIHAPVLALSQTCSVWRNVAMSIPKLWSGLSLNLSCQKEGALNLVKLYLHRSACFPLKINVSAHRTYPDPSDPYRHYSTKLEKKGRSVLQLMLQAYPRWSDVLFDFHLLIYEDYYMREYTDDPSNWHSGPFENLRSLSLSWAANPPDCDSFLFHVLVQRPSPMLHSLHLKEYFTSISESLSSLNPGKISISGVCYDEDLGHIFDIYGQDLRDLVLDVESFEPIEDDIDMVESDQLSSLTINRSSKDEDDPSSTSKIFSCLTLPSLITLDLSVCEDGLQSLLKESLIEFIDRSSCPLQELQLAGNLFSSDRDLIQVLILVPTVTHLALDLLSSHSLYLTQEFFQHLSYDDPLDTLLPRLKTFQLTFRQRGPNVPLPDPDQILSMINSRRLSLMSSLGASDCQQLELFGLSVHLLPNAVAREWASTITSLLRPLRRIGLNIELDIRFLKSRD
ncbi:hypothetical protein VKT23_000553 [Stygiomarasmius scandens]|uniref:F-box domain-containing protein n=1 Tax=Marasmiellus scandens TaxID=2682957 RepID=A0ABR1K4F2_9AGAR